MFYHLLLLKFIKPLLELSISKYNALTISTYDSIVGVSPENKIFTFVFLDRGDFLF